ncbi:MAG: hypothetical protein M0Z98_10370 [Actinomycetales bacterium]|nr:hypothetical protein [Actinomycetales bacterium]
MEIRPARETDWVAIWPFFAAIVEAGETYAYPWPITSDEARRLWMERPPSATFVATDGTAFDSRTHGRVGLHVMHRRLDPS